MFEADNSQASFKTKCGKAKPILYKLFSFGENNVGYIPLQWPASTGFAACILVQEQTIGRAGRCGSALPASAAELDLSLRPGKDINKMV